MKIILKNLKKENIYFFKDRKKQIVYWFKIKVVR